MHGYFDQHIAATRARGELVVQPRMGFGAVDAMRQGLERLARLDFPVAATLTLDSYTRVGDYVTPLDRLSAGEEVNGYPLVSHPPQATRDLLAGLEGPAFPVQVRHGTALPLRVFEALVEVGLDATEGGPVSYCLPYSRLPLDRAVDAWTESCRFLADATESAHIETFGGCLLGQLCPPSLLVAMSVLEGVFFRRHGIPNVSLSYAQGTLAAQDRGAIRALRTLAAEHLGDTIWHVVLYTYMGLFPRTPSGATALIEDSARLARETGCERLIVKTVSEAWQIPSVGEHLDALTLAARAARTATPRDPAADPEADEYCTEVLTEARLLIECVLGLDPDLGRAFVLAFERGLLDIPVSLRRDNFGAATCTIDDRGALVWGSRGRLPLARLSDRGRGPAVTSEDLYSMLGHVARRYDSAAYPVA